MSVCRCELVMYMYMGALTRRAFASTQRFNLDLSPVSTENNPPVLTMSTLTPGALTTTFADPPRVGAELGLVAET